MQADHSAQKGEETPSACLSRLMAEYARMCEENVPFSIKDLAVSGNDLTALGLKGKEIGEMLNAFLQHCMMHPQDNQKNLLISRAKRIYKRKQKQKEEV